MNINEQSLELAKFLWAKILSHLNLEEQINPQDCSFVEFDKFKETYV